MASVFTGHIRSHAKMNLPARLDCTVLFLKVQCVKLFKEGRLTVSFIFRALSAGLP